jgi:hypothetical protein
MALMNLMSSNINQWTVLAAMIPLVYGYSSLRNHGVWRDFHFDDAQRLEILLTLLQSGLALMVLADMAFHWRDASVLFVLWLVQFLQPGLRNVVAIAYVAGMAALVGEFVLGRKALLAPRYFWETVRKAGRSDRPAPQ